MYFESREVVPQISVNAMNGDPRIHKMRVNGHFEKKTLHILINSGSMHNFIRVNLAKKLGYQLSPMLHSESL